MCWKCDFEARNEYTQSQWAQYARHTTAKFQAPATDKLTDAFPIDGVGDLKPPQLTAPALLTVDNVPNSASPAAPVLTVTGPGVTTPIVSTIETIGDQDFYKITLTAGTTYEFGLYSFNGGPNGIGLTDPYLELFAADGSTLVVSGDGGANTAYNQINSGFDVLLTFTATQTGTYYLNARAFSNSAATPTGDSVGDYQLFAREQDPNDPSIYKPYYEPSEPLYALDWGTQVNKVNQSVRNPDGNEGTRDTGNAQGTPVYNANNVPGLDIAALAAAQGKDITGKNVITIYFAKQGDVFASNDPTQPGLPPATITAVPVQDFERKAVFTALGEFEKVADVVYIEVSDRTHADFVYTSYTGTPGPGVSLLGSMSPPDESDEGLAQFNSNDNRWNALNLQQGGFSFVTLIHEFGHGHGMAHPHDNGGRSGIMNGVEAEGAGVADHTTGDFALNQGVFTMMSYEDGWQSSPYGNAPTNVGYGYLGGLMAFDIAAIQDKYGVNEEWATGNDTYTLKDVNAAGTFYYSIWDAGGIDQIVYDGARDATIDLRAATLKYEEGGGGRVSFANGIFGGFTIANGVTIENARSGGGNDNVIGNDAANQLITGAGNDKVNGMGGDDVIYAGAGRDEMTGGAGKDQFLYALVEESGVGLARDVITDFVKGEDKIGLNQIGANSFIGTAAFSGVAGQVNYTIGQGVTVVRLDVDGDRQTDFEIELAGLIQLDSLDFVNLPNGSQRLVGTPGNDTLKGAEGDDVLIGLAGNDLLDGGAGSDTADYSGNSGSFTIDLVVKTAQNTGLTGLDTLVSIENLIGGSGANTLYGDAGNNRLVGGGGKDMLQGRGGDDVLIGGALEDSLDGGLGRDVFVYEAVSDSLRGQGDRIYGFTRGQDLIDLRLIDANNKTNGDDAFAFIGSAAFSGVAGQLRYAQTTAGTVIQADVNGDGIADMEIILKNNVIPTAADFLL